MHRQGAWALATAFTVAAVLAVGVLVSGGDGYRSPSSITLPKPGGGAAGGPRSGVSAGGLSQLRGAQTHPLWWNSSTDDFDRELDMLRDAGANAVRIDISWSSLETEGKGQFSPWYVTKTDTFLQHAKDRGLSVIATFWTTPCWASSAPDTLKQGCVGAWWDREVDRYPATNTTDYADAAAWVAARWGSQLAALEVWNEPNLPDKYSLRADDPAAADAAMLKAAYPRVKEVAPDLPVLGGVLAFSDGDFLQSLYDKGIHGSFDGFSIHPYNEWRDPDDPWKDAYKKYSFLTGVPWIQSILTAHGDGDKGLWLTEFGFSTCGAGDTWCVTPDQQAEYTADSFRIAAGWPFVKAAIAYNLRNKGTSPTGREDQFGLLNRDFTLKPGYAAFSAALLAAKADIPADTPAPVDDPKTPETNAAPGSVATTAAPLPFVVSVGKVGRPSKGRVSVKLRCRPAGRARCRGTLVLRSKAGRVLARAPINARRGSSRAKAVLTRAGRGAFAAGHRVKLVGTVTASHGVRIARFKLTA